MATEWKKVRLGDIATVTSSKRVFANQYTKTGIPFYRQKEIIEKNRGEELSEQLFISNDLYRKMKMNYGVPQKNDLLITGVGVTLGIPYLVKDETFYFKDGNLIWLKDISENVNSQFIFYYINSAEGQKTIWARTIGSAQPALTIDLVKQFQFPCPPLETQQKIAGILYTYDDLIENNRKQIKLLEEAAQKLYKEWFVKLNFPGHENVKIVDGMPEGWIETDINSICTKINAGGTPNRKKSEYWNNKNVKWFKTKELQDCWLYDSEEYISQKGLENSSAKIFPKNTILMAIYASPTLGRLGILTNEACCNQAALCMIANEEFISYQWLYLKLMELREYFNSVARGAGQQNISADVVKNKNIVLPPKSLLDNFTKIIEPYFDKIKSLQNQIQLLQSARDKLLPTLMKGDIDV